MLKLCYGFLNLAKHNFKAALLKSMFLATLLLSALTFAESKVCSNCRAELVASCAGFLEGPAFDADGNLWLVDTVGGVLYRISANECVAQVNTGGNPNGLALGPDGWLYIADNALGLLRVNSESKALEHVATAYENQPFAGLNDLVFDTDGGLYFTDPGSGGAASSVLNPFGRLFYLPAGGSAKDIVLVADHLAFPNGVAISNDGKQVFVAELGAKRILSIPAVGAKGLGVFVYAYLDGGLPDGIEVGRDGRLYVALLFSGAVVALAADGSVAETFLLPKSASGVLTSNLELKNQSIYVTEGERAQLWRIHQP